jgi:hypothetical protein
MGRQGYSQVGYGYTVEEARRDARASAEDEYGHQEGYSGAMNCATSENPPKCLEKPQLSKTCKVEKTVQKGARKWETVFVIEPRWGFSSSIRQDTEIVKGTQGDAIKRAKSLALKNQAEYTIRIEKRLVTGLTQIATVSPKKSKRGKWLFTGDARC